MKQKKKTLLQISRLAKRWMKMVWKNVWFLMKQKKKHFIQPILALSDN